MAAEPIWRASVIRLAIVVEGETEEEFVKQVLASHLLGHDVIAHPMKPRARSGPSGGTITVERLAAQMTKLHRNFDNVTSLVDLYGFQGRRAHETVHDLEHRIEVIVDEKMAGGWNPSKVFAYVQKHEFEGLLFSEVGVFASILDIPASSIASLRTIRASFATPEDIDDGPQTAPSKRIMNLIPSYRKRLYGPIIAEETGLTRIREECPRFSSWVSRLESLAQTGAGPTTA